MNPSPFYRLFEDIWDYLDFKRHKKEFSRTSPDGMFKATLKNEGRWLTYILSACENDEISVTLQRFRASARRLREFHTGCARIARDMKRFIRSGNRKWLSAERPFGLLHGGILLPCGNILWRGYKDDPDPDEWMDMVEDEGVARLLDRADRMTRHYSSDEDAAIQRQNAWELLESIPAQHEFHVEVLKRRVQLIYGNDHFEDIPKTVRWARALVEAEPDEVTNWWWLDDAVERLEGKAAAVEVLREALKHHGPDFTLFYGLADHLCALDRLEEAKEAMLLALKEDIFALKGALESKTFAPIHDYIRELMESDWYLNEKEEVEKRYGTEDFDL